MGARGAIAFKQTVNLRDHIAGDQVPAPRRVFAIGPVVDEAQHRAEAARGRRQLADRRYQIVRRADDGRGVVGESGLVHRLVGGGEGRGAWAHQGAHGIFVVPMHQALARLGAGLLPGLGDVPGHQDPPVLAINHLARLGRRLLGEAPLGGQGREPRV